MLIIVALIDAFLKVLSHNNFMYYIYTVALLVMFCILMADLSRKQFSYVTVLKLTTIGFIFFALEFIKKYYPSWVLIAGICCMILAPCLVSGDLFKKKK